MDLHEQNGREAVKPFLRLDFIIRPRPSGTFKNARTAQIVIS